MLASLGLLLIACGDDDGGGGADDADASDPVNAASCDPGQVAACTGLNGCSGAQMCQASGHYGACECGAVRSDGGTPPVPGRDAGPVVSGPIACGAACTSDEQCGGGGSCIAQRDGEATVEGLGMLTVALFPGGMCSQTPLLPFDDPQACDPTRTGAAQGCGACGECVPVVFADTVATVCREKCQPSATTSGCSRPEYTCSFGFGACIEGCVSDQECRLYTEDNDGDGESDALVYDATSAAFCNMATRRCTVPGKPGAQAGDPCMRDDDCEADGFCLTESGTDYELPIRGGYCAKAGCEIAGLECAGQGACTNVRSWDPTQALGTICARDCQHGVEAAALQLGAAGHGEGCREGYMCMWDGVANNPGGTCLPGNYNAVAANNVGTLCQAHTECFSPFGHGRCLTVGSSQQASASFCTLLDCNTPGLPADFCGAGNSCLRIDQDLSACFKSCQDATQCADGLACIALGSDAASKVCIFGCEQDSECRPGQTCSASGACTGG